MTNIEPQLLFERYPLYLDSLRDNLSYYSNVVYPDNDYESTELFRMETINKIAKLAVVSLIYNETHRIDDVTLDTLFNDFDDKDYYYNQAKDRLLDVFKDELRSYVYLIRGAYFDKDKVCHFQMEKV